MSPILTVQNLNLSFGGIKAVQDVTFEIRPNELLGLIGPNGAGKTTIFNMISGFYCQDSGVISLCGTDLAEKKPDEVNRAGIARTFQNIRLFSNLTVIENVVIALQQRQNFGWFESLFQTETYLKKESDMRFESFDLLKIFNLHSFAEEKACNLPYGLQRKLEIVRALATKPKLLILDEPAAGMNHSETQELNQLIRFIKEKFNLTILLIEHDMKLVMNICDRIVVLNRGQKIAEGLPTEIKTNKDVIEAYLGKSSHA